jgi:A/G-specific adenine glycosylase
MDAITQETPARHESSEDETVADLRALLLRWYRENRRDLPWRRTRDPYRILVSEVMLQQTQVERVIPKYHAFLSHFPTIHALAAAPTADVIRVWSGLGYNRRAVNLQRMAHVVVERHGGIMPRDLDALQALPGIGRYTAGAIACFAYEQDVGFLDTNIRRVVHRLILGPDVPAERGTQRLMQDLADRLVPAGQGYDWNQALIEFGAVQCTARKPACLTCHLQTRCRAFPEIQTLLSDRQTGVQRKREPRFEGSTRYYRGRVIEALRTLGDGEAVDLASLGPMVRDDFSGEHLPWLADIVRGLRNDGLAQIAEDDAEYDASEPSQIRVRLP